MCLACVRGSKRRSYGSWLSGRRGELLKTNSRLNSDRTRRWRPHSYSWTIGAVGTKSPVQITQEQGGSHEVQTFGKTQRHTVVLQKKPVRGEAGGNLFSWFSVSQ